MAGVLLVEEDYRVRTFLSFLLDEEDYAVTEAKNGWEAVNFFRKNVDAIDIVLLSIKPPGIEQLQTLSALQRIKTDIRFCFLTEDYPEEGLQILGARAVFPKPITEPEKFTRAFRRIKQSLPVRTAISSSSEGGTAQ